MRNSPNNVWSAANFDCADAKKIPTAFWSGLVWSGLVWIFTNKWAQQILSRYAKTENHNACRKTATDGALQPAHQCSQFFLGETHASIALKL